MKVKELIAELQRLDPDLVVECFDSQGGFWAEVDFAEVSNDKWGTSMNHMHVNPTTIHLS